MAESFATPADIEARWRILTPAETNVAYTLVEDASDMIRVRWSDVDARIAAGSLTAQTLTRVVATMVKRAMMSPLEGVSSAGQSAGAFSQNVTYANPSANLYLTADEVRLFDGYTSGSRMGWLL